MRVAAPVESLTASNWAALVVVVTGRAIWVSQEGPHGIVQEIYPGPFSVAGDLYLLRALRLRVLDDGADRRRRVDEVMWNVGDEVGPLGDA